MPADASLSQLLKTEVTSKVVTQVAASTSELLGFFGFQGNDKGTDGVNVRRIGRREVGWDIFNDARSVALSRMPGVAAATVRRQSVGRVNATFPRMNEKLPLMFDELDNFRRIGGPASEFDEAGKDYLMKQQRYLGQRAANWRLALTVGMMRGHLYGHQVGDDLYHDFNASGASFDIDYRIPTGNTGTLNMLGAGAIIDTVWTNAAADIPGHCAKINAAFQQLAGTNLKNMVMNSATFQQIVDNTNVQRQAGTSNTQTTRFEREVGKGTNGRPLCNQHAKIAGTMGLFDILITDQVMDTGLHGGFVTEKLIPDGKVWFGPEINDNIFEMLLGSEIVVEGPGKTPTKQFGLHAWSKETDDPACVSLYTIDNAMPALYVPAATAWATVY